MAEIGIYTCPDHRNGDTSNAKTFAVTVDADPVNLTGALIKTTFVDAHTLRPAGSLEVGDGITITNAAGGVYRWDKNAIANLLTTGSYKWDTQITFSGEALPVTWIKGTINIVRDYTT